MEKKAYYPVYSYKLCNTLLRAGCTVHHVDLNNRDGCSIVFYFDKDEKLEAYVSYYTMQARIQQFKENIDEALGQFNEKDR